MSMEVTRTIKLHGWMGEKYGETVQLAGKNMFQIMSGLTSRFGPQFKEDVRAGNWHVIDGALRPGNDLSESDLNKTLQRKTLHLVPAVVGASAVFRVIVGIVLVVAGLYFQQPWLVNLGAAMILGGVVEMLTKPVKNTPDQKQDDQGSYIYNVAANITSQGGPVPLLFGRVQRASSVVITTDFSSDEILGTAATDPGGGGGGGGGAHTPLDSEYVESHEY